MKTVYILGAGADKHLGMPLANELMSALADFAEGEGKPIAKALRDKLPYLRFSFNKYRGEQAELLAARIFSGGPEVLEHAKAALTRFIGQHPEEEAKHVSAVLKIITKIEGMRDQNEVDDETLQTLFEFYGQRRSESGGDHIVDPRSVHLTHDVRQAFRMTFQDLIHEPNVSSEEREALTEMATALMGVEELLGTLFAGFYTNQQADQKRYLFLAWLFWAYVRITMFSQDTHSFGGFYESFDSLDIDFQIITMNYTNRFFPSAVLPRVKFFHGDCTSYLRLETRELITESENQLLKDATSPSTVTQFIQSLDINPSEKRTYLPGIVPPLAVKPVICRQHLETWYHCGEIIDAASRVIVAGYSFNQVDEHFNDLLRKRKGQGDTDILVINPDLTGSADSLCNILSHERNHLDKTYIGRYECLKDRSHRDGRDGKLLFAKVSVEELSARSRLGTPGLDGSRRARFVGQAKRAQSGRTASAEAAGATWLDVPIPNRTSR